MQKQTTKPAAKPSNKASNKAAAKAENKPAVAIFAAVYIAALAQGNKAVTGYFKAAESNGKAKGHKYPRAGHETHVAEWQAMPQDKAKAEIADIFAAIAQGKGREISATKKARSLFDLFMIEAGRQIAK
jgi:hypothetical protein